MKPPDYGVAAACENCRFATTKFCLGMNVKCLKYRFDAQIGYVCSMWESENVADQLQ